VTADPAAARLVEVATVDEQRFRVMGSDAHVIVVGGPDGLAEMARARLEYLEGRWSRFREDSELSVANAQPGRWTEVSPETVQLVERALVAHERTDGLFDPTRLHDVVAAGYSTSFDELASVHDAPVGTSSPTAPHDPVEIDRPGLRMRIPSGCGFDPGGIGKGVAADLVSSELMAEGADGVCVNVGGDLRVRGAGPDGGDWVVGIEDPRDPDAPPLARLHLSDGAVATSSRLRRRWTRADGSDAHHLIDPRTGEPARTEVLTATVVAAEGWQAEALAKTAFLSPLDGFLARLADAGATGLVLTTSGVVPAPGLDAFSR
jgi:FAD:protein FMN transferase